MTTFGGDIYQQVEVNTANKLRLVVMLYDGAIRFLTQAKSAVQTKNLAGKAVAIDRSLAIVGELQSTLRLDEGGEIAQSLNRLYAYMTERILEASVKLDVRPLDEVIKLLKILDSAWTDISRKSEERHDAPAPKSVPNIPVGGMPSLGGTPRSLEIVG